MRTETNEKEPRRKAVLSTKGEKIAQNLCIVFLVKHTESAEKKRMNYEVNPIL